jgi:hypothetical protein
MARTLSGKSSSIKIMGVGLRARLDVGSESGLRLRLFLNGERDWDFFIFESSILSFGESPLFPGRSLDLVLWMVLSLVTRYQTIAS